MKVTQQQPPTPTPTYERAPGVVSTPWQVPWPDGTVARYWTVAGATVDITEIGEAACHGHNVACTGCPYWETPGTEDDAHRQAQAHAERCRALPRPAVTQ